MSLIKPFKHQLKSLSHDLTTPIVYDCSDPGCVSADTQFLTPTGWKRIDQYTRGDQVAQFHPADRTIEFVLPSAYVKKPCTTMIAIAPARGMSQRLSAEHRVLTYNRKGEHSVQSAQEFMEQLHKKTAAHHDAKFCSTFTVTDRPGLGKPAEYLRVMVAVIADGHFNNNTNRCTVRLKKERKIERMGQLLRAASIPFRARRCLSDPEFNVFTFTAPRREKEFTSWWWDAQQQELEVIAQEVCHWDSSEDSRPSDGTRFSTFIEASADFVQYAFAAAKRPASNSYTYRNRMDEGRGLMVEYTVHARSRDGLIGPGRESSVYPVNNPEGFKYCFEVPSSFLLLRHNGYIFATGNTGKTFVASKAFERRRKKKSGCALVLAPKTLLRSVWQADLKKFCPTLTSIVSTAGKHDFAFGQDVDVYITNIDAVKWLAQQPKTFFRKFDMLIVDEVPAYKHHSSQRSKAASKIAGYFKHKRVMTGTPNGNTICDVWHQVYLLDEGKRLGNSFYKFRESVCTPKQVGASAHAIHWTDREGAEEAVFSLLEDIVIRHKFEDCVDIPENHQYQVPYTLAPAHRKAYDEMMETNMLQMYGPIHTRTAMRMKGKPMVPLSTVSALHAGVAAQKLFQIASGAVYENPEKYHIIDTGRYELIMDLVEARKHSLVLFLWKHQRDLLMAEADKRGITYAMIDGSVGDDERNRIVTMYQAGKFQTLFGHPKSVAHGLTLTKGTATIWASPTYDLEIFKQGSKRQHRMGQTEKTETIIVTAEDTLDQDVYNKMLVKDARMTTLLDLFSNI